MKRYAAEPRRAFARCLPTVLIILSFFMAISIGIASAQNTGDSKDNKMVTEPYKTSLITRWGKDVTADNAWREYPRPQLMREAWQNLNGLWDYTITAQSDTAVPENWQGQLLVPFCLESRLGGVQQLLQPDQALWYRRSIDLEIIEGVRTLLNFEAVDYRCEVRVNGEAVGSHQGGNMPFTFDITDVVKVGENEIIVRVEDETEAWQLRGKQVLKNRGIWYTRVSGIWQSVWLEQVPLNYIEDIHLTTEAAAGSIEIKATVKGSENLDKLRVLVKDGTDIVRKEEGPASGLILKLQSPKLWTPDNPHLYDLEIELLDNSGNSVDRVGSYTGIRTVGKVRDKEGHLRFTLNGEEIFHWGPLDQGWWPDGLLTPPSDAAMRYDVEFLKAAGFNMIRKHIKQEPRRYYYHCDQIGMMVWQDQPSGGENPRWVFLSKEPQDAQWPDDAHEQYMYEIKAMMDTLKNHPSIVVWVPFNEAWGQHRSIEVGEWVMGYDPGRLVNIASGGNFFPVGDIADAHAYPEPKFPFEADRYDAFIKVVGEFGGHGYPVSDHLWDPQQKNWGYGKELPKSLEEYQARFEKTLAQLNDLRGQGIAAGVYTQTTDVEIEINGLLTYDREVEKIPAAELGALRRNVLPKLTETEK
ncbi:MAG: glycoside hydrolase family 2 [Candidatus Hydrogenedentes bacterium]|jgi:beta-galactosidase/beta-glucuronidase|nr:glycoside hydrolase family 2 [Candidatus Hydrogenedentota bacterium]